MYCDSMVGYGVYGRPVVSRGVVVHLCSRKAQFEVVWNGKVVEILCSQHAAKVRKAGLAEGFELREIQ